MLLSSVQFVRAVRISGDPSCERIDPALSRYRGYVLELLGDRVEMTSAAGDVYVVPVTNVACFTPAPSDLVKRETSLTAPLPTHPAPVFTPDAVWASAAPDVPIKRGPGRPRKVTP